MLNYLEKFKKLPQSLRNKVSSPLVMKNITTLEKKYNIDLAITVMKVMVKEVSFNNLPNYLAEEFKLSQEKNQELLNELVDKVFKDVKEYLGISSHPAEIKKFSNFDPNFPKRQIRDSKSLDKNDGYLFSPEDEEEIRELTKKIDGYGKTKTKSNSQEKVDDIIKKIGINFGASYLEQRFRDIISTYIRGIRDRIDTRITLGKTLDGGGLGLDSGAIDKVLMIADNSLETETPKTTPISKISSPKIKKEAKDEKIDIMKNIGARDVDYNLKKVLEEKENDVSTDESEKNKNSLTEKLDLEHELAPPPPKLATKEKTKIIVNGSQINKKNEVEKNKKSNTEKKKELSQPPAFIKKESFSLFKKNKKEIKLEPVRLKSKVPASPSGKKKMEDVSVVPRVMNPIDELKYMDLITFRRLGQDASKIVKKISSKIKLLEEDDYSKRMDGIRAWRNSPVNRLYLSIGEESISNNKAIDAIIKTRKSQKKDYLDEKEFKAIMDLNKDLRF